jgi:glycosylphosphatidylinositol transamidase (GPIT) subunit GPI8
MPKRKTNESSDSNNKTSTEPARDIQQNKQDLSSIFSLVDFRLYYLVKIFF